MAELDEAKTDDNLKQDLDKLGRVQLLDCGDNWTRGLLKKILEMTRMRMRLMTWPAEGRRMPMVARVRRAGGREISLESRSW